MRTDEVEVVEAGRGRGRRGGRAVAVLVLAICGAVLVAWSGSAPARSSALSRLNADESTPSDVADLHRTDDQDSDLFRSKKKIAMVHILSAMDIVDGCSSSFQYAYCAYSSCTVADGHTNGERPTAAFCSCPIINGVADINLDKETGLSQFLLDRSEAYVGIVEAVANGETEVEDAVADICELTQTKGLFPQLNPDLVSWPSYEDEASVASSWEIEADDFCPEVTMTTCLGAPCWVDSNVKNLNATCLCALLPKRRDIWLRPAAEAVGRFSGSLCDLFSAGGSCAVNGDDLMGSWLDAPELTADDASRLAAAALDSYPTLSVMARSTSPQCRGIFKTFTSESDDGEFYDDAVTVDTADDTLMSAGN